MDTNGYRALFVPLLIEKLPFNLRKSIAKTFEDYIWELPEMLRAYKVTQRLRNVLFQSEVLTVKLLQIDTHHLHYILVLKVLRKNVFCDKNHSTSRCIKITDPRARKPFLSSNGHCFICFGNFHATSSCKQNCKCKKCNGRHHISICTFSKPKNCAQAPQNGQSQNSQSDPATPDQDSTSNNFSTNRNNILMQTAAASVSNLEKNSVRTDLQAIFDS